MPRKLPAFSAFILLTSLVLVSQGFAQRGIGGLGSGRNNSTPAERPQFRDHVNQQGGPRIVRDANNKIVVGVAVRGNRIVKTDRILKMLDTRVDRVYALETVLSDIRKLNELGAFKSVDFDVKDQSDGKQVTFTVSELPTISKVHFHGNRGLNDKELSGRAGLNEGDPINEFAIESALRRIQDFYKEKGFNNAVIRNAKDLAKDPRAVVFEINEGTLERISKIKITGNQIVSESRLKKIIKSRDSFMIVGRYLRNRADIEKINRDVDILTAYYRNLGFLNASVSRGIQYDRTGKWMTVTFVIEEGQRFVVNDVHVVGNQFFDEESLLSRLKLLSSEHFNGDKMNLDKQELIDVYGDEGFIYAEVVPQIRILDSASNKVNVNYQIVEGDRWKIGEIQFNIEGEPHLMKHQMLLNQVDLVEGQYINRNKLKQNQRRLGASRLFETNPSVASPPELRVVPRDDSYDR